MILPKVQLKGIRGTPAVTINYKTKEEVTEAIREASAETLLENVQINWKFLQDEAQKFLDNYYSLQKQGQAISDNLLKSSVYSGMNNSDDPNFAEKVNYMAKLSDERRTNLLRAKYLLAVRFEEVLNAFRGSLPSKMVYVQEIKDDNSTILNSYVMSTRELIFEADKHGRFKFETKKNNRIAEWQKAGRQLLESQDKKNQLFSDSHLKESLAAYNGTYNRVSRFREVTHTSENKPALLLWRGGNQQWQYGYVGNKGDIKEGYIHLLYQMHRHCEVPGNAIYYAHSLIGDFYTHHLTTVTSLAAIIEEDVKLVENNIQYGIKSNQAGLPGYSQYLAIASDIVLSPKLSKEELEEALRTWLPQPVDHTKTTTLEEIAEKYPTLALGKLQKTVDKG